MLDAPRKKMKKDPLVKTHFLPDKYRDQEQKLLVDALKKEWSEKQEAMQGKFYLFF